nr:FkbM family methyltransferase [Entomospira entomophilus]
MREFFEDLHQVKNGFYIDVGAFHPYRISNTAYYYLSGWRGINVEPNPISFKNFEQERPEDINLNVGVADQKGELTYYYYGENDAGNTFSVAQKERQLVRLKREPQETFTIPVIDINEVFRYANGREVDFLTIDVESFELTILQQLDFTKYRPKMILVELLHTTLANLAEDSIYQLLTSHNYGLYAHTMRTFFFKKNDMEKSRYEPDITVKI